MSKKDYDYVGPGTYAYKEDGEWYAGKNSKKYEAGTPVSESYAKQVRASINFRNRVKGLVQKPGEKDELPDTYAESQEVISEFNELDKELEKADTEAEREDIKDDINDLRSRLGS